MLSSCLWWYFQSRAAALTAQASEGETRYLASVLIHWSPAHVSIKPVDCYFFLFRGTRDDKKQDMLLDDEMGARGTELAGCVPLSCLYLAVDQLMIVREL